MVASQRGYTIIYICVTDDGKLTRLYYNNQYMYIQQMRKLTRLYYDIYIHVPDDNKIMRS